MNSLELILFVTTLAGASAFQRTTIFKERPLIPLYATEWYKPIPVYLYLEEHGRDNPVKEDETSPLLAQDYSPEQSQKPLSELDQSADDVSSIRSRRSTQPGAPSPQGGQSGDRGGVEVGVSRGDGGSRRVEARGEGNVWQSNDGRGRVDVHGHYSRDYGGRYGTQRPQYGGGIRYSHRF
ncbi:uncharacterized protein LOC124154134 [Ischnura elegans]|uniref:uncharacterized protein LOC124154134 n=1 Tax=Ischnura elegans TaxID=197161 RepID=UPI001ED87135|nr:uncharacterized protein LOC124154134 [Ischnura elegans]